MDGFNERTRREFQEFADAFNNQYFQDKGTKKESYYDEPEPLSSYNQVFGVDYDPQKDAARALQQISAGPMERVRKVRSTAAPSQPRVLVPLQREMVKIRKLLRHQELLRGTQNAYARMEDERAVRRALSYKPPARRLTIPKTDFGGVGIDMYDVPEIVGSAGMATNQPYEPTSFKDHSLITGRGMLGANGEAQKASPYFF